MADTERQLSNADWIAPDQLVDLHAILCEHQLLGKTEEVLSVSLAGDGNMNCTLRVRTATKSLVVKQSRPWVEKYPSIPAPVDRALHEIQFYQTVAGYPEVAQQMPRLLASDSDRYLLVLEDLGESKDGSMFYDAKNASQRIEPHLPQLAIWLAGLHNIRIDEAQHVNYQNLALRELNHAHIFDIPFHDPPAINLDSITPGLTDLAAEYSNNQELVCRASDLGDAYLHTGTCLLHGDFFPGSWLFVDGQVRVIDPEFCYLGRPEFDVAVCMAHLRMIGVAPAAVDRMWESYHANRSAGDEWDQSLVDGWAGVETIRRLLGVAQLPLERTLDEKRRLLEWAASMCFEDV